jgi:hypothetical protein
MFLHNRRIYTRQTQNGIEERINNMKKVTALIYIILTLTCLTANAEENDLYQPFVLASLGAGNLEAKTESVAKALKAAKFEIVSIYSPYPSAKILVVTNAELKKNASESHLGGFGAAQRVALTKVKGEIQVSYTNPVYMAHGYRMKNNLETVALAMGKALGKKEEFGGKGITAAALRKYHYLFGLEHFDEPTLLAEYETHEAAIAAVEAGLEAKREGVSKVFRIDIPHKNETVFGVVMAGKLHVGKDQIESVPEQTEQFGPILTSAPEADSNIMRAIDFGALKATAHLPYEILVDEKKIYAQSARFRIALNFPSLEMMGNNSFDKIMNAPEAIKKVLKKTVSDNKSNNY